MKKLLFAFFAVVMVSASVKSQSQDTRFMQELDLITFGYPIIYEEPTRSTDSIYIDYKNISSKVITKTVFTYSIQGRNINLTDNGTIQPNASKRSGWSSSQDLRYGSVTRVEVTFSDGETRNYEVSQAEVMLENRYYTTETKEKLVSLSAKSRLEEASNLQIQDLLEFGYPIIFEEPSINRNTGFVIINFKNISPQVISKVNFTLRLMGGTTHDLPTTNPIQPNETVRVGWTPPGALSSAGSGITVVDVTFGDGKTVKYETSQATLMLADKYYSDQILQVERQRAAQEQAARERIAQEQAARERAAQEQAERQRIAQETAARERAERQRLEEEAAARRQREQEEARIAEAERQRVAQEQAVREQAERQRIAQEQATRRESEQDVSDYFPVFGNSWIYANSRNLIVETVTVRASAPDNVSNDGTMLHLFETQWHPDIGTTASMYSIKDNKVVVLTTRNILGQYRENRRPFPIELAPAGQEWRQDNDEEYYLFKTTRSSIRYDDKSFNDCILVEQRIYIEGSLFLTKKTYYARGVGMVYVTLQSPGESETVYKKLIN